MNRRCLFLPLLLFVAASLCAQDFVQRKGTGFALNGKPYYYVGTNYWYGGLLPLNKSRAKGFERLRTELDFLAAKGVTNLRVMAAVEGEGQINGVQRIRPSLQTAKGRFDTAWLKGLDVLLAEMNRRGMKAVLILSNNWEWSGGFLQYLNWNGRLPDSIFRRKLSWNEMRDYVSGFYGCRPCVDDYKKQVAMVINRVNSITGKKYSEEPAVMAWELANEPRPMRPAAIPAYEAWASSLSSYVKSLDKNHLVTLGTEGETGTENADVFQSIHADKNVDYLTVHVWPKNWGWFKDTAVQSGLGDVIAKTRAYVQKHLAAAEAVQKPLVIEEFGLPRDGLSFDPAAATSARDVYYNGLLALWKQQAQNGGCLAGLNFWGFGGSARPVPGQTYWKEGDAYTADPPMEEQGLNAVFDSDRTTWELIYQYTSSTGSFATVPNTPSDKHATPQTVALYRNLKRLAGRGILFGHQDDLAYGVGWRYVDGKSDVKETTADYPALYGWELGNIEHDLPYNLDSVPFDKMRAFIRQGYERGGVITISWHADNPVNGESAWDTTHGAVASILPGGSKHELYVLWLDRIAAFLQSLKGKGGEAIPVLFRPYHELTGNWFWWCRNATSPTEFKLLWRFTVDYLKNEKGLHHLLYVYNTAGEFDSKEAFLDYYPGNDVVDVVSFDHYQSGPGAAQNFIADVDRRLTIVESIAKEKAKIPALAETGLEAVPDAGWWTNTLWKAIGSHAIAYVLLWRNHGRQPNGRLHYYVPFKGDVSADDFKKFYALDKTWFQKEAAEEKLYKAATR